MQEKFNNNNDLKLFTSKQIYMIKKFNHTSFKSWYPDSYTLKHITNNRDIFEIVIL